MVKLGNPNMKRTEEKKAIKNAAKRRISYAVARQDVIVKMTATILGVLTTLQKLSLIVNVYI